MAFVPRDGGYWVQEAESEGPGFQRKGVLCLTEVFCGVGPLPPWSWVVPVGPRGGEAGRNIEPRTAVIRSHGVGWLTVEEESAEAHFTARALSRPTLCNWPLSVVPRRLAIIPGLKESGCKSVNLMVKGLGTGALVLKPSPVRPPGPWPSCVV